MGGCTWWWLPLPAGLVSPWAGSNLCPCLQQQQGCRPRAGGNQPLQALVSMAQPPPTALLALRGKNRPRWQPQLPSWHGQAGTQGTQPPAATGALTYSPRGGQKGLSSRARGASSQQTQAARAHGLAVARREQSWQLSHSPCPQPINLSRGQGSGGRIILFPRAKPQLQGINAGSYIKERGAGARQRSASDPRSPPRMHPGTRTAEQAGDVPSP